MIRILALISGALLASTAAGDEGVPASTIDAWTADRSIVFDANTVNIEDLLWVARPVVVFADSPNDPRFLQQLDLWTDRPDDLAIRDVILLTDTDPGALGAWRTALRPRGFMLVIIGKDGEVELRKPAPWDVREITRSIDKMPLRQQEVEDRRGLEP